MKLRRRAYLWGAMAGSAWLIALGVTACSSSSKGTTETTDGSVASDGQTSTGTPKDGSTGTTSNDGSPTSTGDGATGSGGDDESDGGGGGSWLDSGVNGPHATMRVIDVADPPDFYWDYCVSTDAVSSTTKWVGPMLRASYTFLSVDDYDSLTQVSPYLNVAVGTKSLRLVLFDSADCSETVQGIPDFTLKTPLAQDTRSTVALAGTAFDAGAQPLEVFQYTDIVAAADGPNSLRVINLSQAESPGADVYVYAGYNNKLPCTEIYDNIPFGGVGTAKNVPGDGGPTDSNGYTPLRGENFYDLTFQSYTMAFVKHGGDCSNPYTTFYSTDYAFGQGAWTLYMFDDNYKRVVCRDDGTQNPLCEHH